MPLPIITPRLIIRPFRSGDLEALHAIYGDPRVSRQLRSSAVPGRNENTHRLEWYIELQEQFGYSMWAVEEKQSGDVVADCGFFPYEWQGPEVELAYHVLPDAWGRGYASEAARACLEYGLTRPELTRRGICALTFPDHHASRRVLEKIGMKHVDTGIAYGTEMVRYEP